MIGAKQNAVVNVFEELLQNDDSNGRLEVDVMRLTEKYYMATPCGLVEVKGKEYRDGFAITYNHIKKIYNITHIESGTSLVKEGFKKLQDCLESADKWIEKGNVFCIKIQNI